MASNDLLLRFSKRFDADKGRDSWIMTEPRQADAKDSELFALLYKLWSLRAEVIEVEEASDAELAKRGLSPPKIRAELFDEEGSSLVELRFGEVAGEYRYVTSSTRPWIGTVLANKTDAFLIDVVEADHFIEDAR